jgi:hypothetical protein
VKKLEILRETKQGRRVASADMPDRWDRGRTTSGRAWKTIEANRKPFRFRHGDQEWVKKCMYRKQEMRNRYRRCIGKRKFCIVKREWCVKK